MIRNILRGLTYIVTIVVLGSSSAQELEKGTKDQEKIETQERISLKSPDCTFTDIVHSFIAKVYDTGTEEKRTKSQYANWLNENGRYKDAISLLRDDFEYLKEYDLNDIPTEEMRIEIAKGFNEIGIAYLRGENDDEKVRNHFLTALILYPDVAAPFLNYAIASMNLGHIKKDSSLIEEGCNAAYRYVRMNEEDPLGKTLVSYCDQNIRQSIKNP